MGSELNETETMEPESGAAADGDLTDESVGGVSGGPDNQYLPVWGVTFDESPSSVNAVRGGRRFYETNRRRHLIASFPWHRGYWLPRLT
jgi:hypothetical protein